jgi:hypothetical protein
VGRIIPASSKLLAAAARWRADPHIRDLRGEASAAGKSTSDDGTTPNNKGLDIAVPDILPGNIFEQQDRVKVV